MRKPEGESDRGPRRSRVERRLEPEIHGSRIPSDAGILAYRELEDALGPTALASEVLADCRTGKKGRHRGGGLLRQSGSIGARFSAGSVPHGESRLKQVKDSFSPMGMKRGAV